MQILFWLNIFSKLLHIFEQRYIFLQILSLNLLKDFILPFSKTLYYLYVINNVLNKKSLGTRFALIFFNQECKNLSLSQKIYSVPLGSYLPKLRDSFISFSNKNTLFN